MLIKRQAWLHTSLLLWRPRVSQQGLLQTSYVCMQAGHVTKKNSCSRNLFRLCHGVLFISELLKFMYKDKAMLLRTACAEAYNNTLASAHSWMVKNAIRTSMYMLPTREQFLTSIKETGKHLLHRLPQLLLA